MISLQTKLKITLSNKEIDNNFASANEMNIK